LANLNRIILVGRLAADPESRSTMEGLPIAKFKLAVSRPMAQGATGTDFIDVVAWRKLAEICGQYLKKGRLVLVEGRIQNRSFENQVGQRSWVTEVVASNMTMLDQPSAAPAPAAFASEAEAEEEAVDDTDLASDLPF
jgi:single-strand DNA-binding protein